MTEARCPLVREIEEAAVAVVGTDDPTVYAPAVWQHMVDLWRVTHSLAWPRIRAALEAAQDLRAEADARGWQPLPPGPDVNEKEQRERGEGAG